MAVTTDELIEAAASKLNPKQVEDRLFGNVASALVTTDSSMFFGVCIDTRCGMGFCAEHAAIAAMVTAGQYRIKTIVAVWRNGDQQDHPVHVVAPCGRCREFIYAVDKANIDAEVVLGPGRTVSLRALLPDNEWPGPIWEPRRA